MLDSLCLYIHYAIIVFVISCPFLCPTKYLINYLLFVLILILHWYILNGKCIIALLHKETSNDNGAIIDFLEKTNMRSDNININYILDTILYTLILVGSYRLNRLVEGIFIVIIIVLLNKTIYNSYNFRWDNKKIITK